MNAFDFRSFALAGVCVGAFALHPRAVDCVIPAPSDHETHLLWGGETRQVFVSEDGETIHTAEDGGRIRRSIDGGDNWEFATTPIDVTQSLLDVWFSADGTGYACGRGGRILKSDDDGETWEHIDTNNKIHYDSNSEPATLWRVRFLSASVGMVCGLGVFEGTGNGGQGSFAATWADIKLFPDSSLDPDTQIPTSDLEFYCLDVVGDVTGGFVGIAGAEWEDGSTDRGIVFRTNSTTSGTSAGRKWWIALDDSLDTTSDGNMKEPWDLEFARGSTSLTSSVAMVVGGPGTNFAGRFYRSTDSGANWTLEGSLPVTMYGIAVMPDGYALQTGYSGNVWSRNPSTAVWTQHDIPAVGGVGGNATSVINAVHGCDSEDYVLAGASGVQRRTTDYGDTFDFLNPSYHSTHGEAPWRVWDVFFLPNYPSIGFVCGQVQLVAKTIDGGCTWVAMNGGLGGGGFAASNLFDIEFSNDTDGVAVGDLRPPLSGVPHLYWTVDEGETWDEATFGSLDTDEFILRSVSHAGGLQWWAVGMQETASGPDLPLVLFSEDGGESWTQEAAPDLDGLDLVDVDFVSTSEGLAIGVEAGVGRAYIADFDGDDVVWTEITLTGVSGRLNALAMEGSALSSAQGYVVGDGGVIQEWDNTNSEFDAVTPECALSVDFMSVALAPDSDEVLVGAKYDFDEANAAEDGYLVRFDGTEWECVRANAGFDIKSIQLLSTESGHMVGGIGADSASFDHGKVADSAIFSYVRNE